MLRRRWFAYRTCITGVAVIAVATFLQLGGPTDSPTTRLIPSAAAAPPDENPPGHSGGAMPPITAMTLNLYQGADLTPIIVSPTPPTVELVFSRVVHTNFPARAQEVARIIAISQPDVIGLQEASLWRSQTPGDFLMGNFAPNALTVEFDYLQILLDELEAIGTPYEAVVIKESFDAELPGIGRDLRITDRDVILVRADRPAGAFDVSNPQSGIFAFFVPIPLPLPPPFNILPFKRAWVSIDVQSRGREFRVISTHLDNLSPIVNRLQGMELVSASGPADTDLPVILLGDFNAAADGGFGNATYADLLAAGFEDAWLYADPDDDGFTCCQDPILDNPTSLLDERIDLILFRDGAHRGRSPDPDFLVRDVFTVGDTPLPIPINGTVNWASDHAGVVAELRLHP